MNVDERGFTLLEVLVAMTLLAIVVGFMVSGGRMMAALRDGLRERGAAITEAAVAVELMRSRLGDAIFVDIGEPGRTEAAFDGERRRVRFVTLRRNYEGGFPRIAWELSAPVDAEGSKLLLRVADFPFDVRDFDDLDWTERRVLLESRSDLSFSYFGRQDAEREPTWQDEWREQPRLPVAFNLKPQSADARVLPAVVLVQTHVPSLCATEIDSESPACMRP